MVMTPEHCKASHELDEQPSAEGRPQPAHVPLLHLKWAQLQPCDALYRIFEPGRAIECATLTMGCSFVLPNIGVMAACPVVRIITALAYCIDTAHE